MFRIAAVLKRILSKATRHFNRVELRLFVVSSPRRDQRSRALATTSVSAGSDLEDLLASAPSHRTHVATTPCRPRSAPGAAGCWGADPGRQLRSAILAGVSGAWCHRGSSLVSRPIEVSLRVGPSASSCHPRCCTCPPPAGALKQAARSQASQIRGLLLSLSCTCSFGGSRKVVLPAMMSLQRGACGRSRGFRLRLGACSPPPAPASRPPAQG